MSYSALDQQKELAQAMKNRRLFLFLFLAASAAYLTGLLLCLFLSGDTYWPYLLVLMVITIVYLWFAIFCFSAAFPAQNKRIHFLQQSLIGPYEEKTLTFLRHEDGLVEKEGIWATLCRGGYQEKGKDFDFEFYLPGDIPEWKEGSTIRIRSFRRIVLSYEVVS